MSLKNIWRILLILLMFGPFIHARENHTEIMVDFRVNVIYLDKTYKENASRIKDILSFLKKLKGDSTVTITSLKICGAASPEGPDAWNRHLARGRMTALENLIRHEVDLPDSIISRDGSYIPWKWLREKVAVSDFAWRDSVVSILDAPSELVIDNTGGKPVDSRIVKLKALDGGKVWAQLFRHYFADMRNAAAVIVTCEDAGGRLSEVHVPTHLAVTPCSPSGELDLTLPASDARRQSADSKPFYMDVRSNLITDILAIPNLGVEFYLGRNLSVGAGYMHAWWSHDRRHRYWRLYGADVNVRYWFGHAAETKPLTGHHIGLYAQAVTFDFEFGGQAYMGGEPGGTIFDRAHFGGGIEYGYSLPVGRHFNLDFNLGVGYIGGRVYKFKPANGRYVWTNTETRRWFGPTRLEVSLMWLVGRDNVNQRKGGAR